jgi:hypothetical protein
MAKTKNNKAISTQTGKRFNSQTLARIKKYKELLLEGKSKPEIMKEMKLSHKRYKRLIDRYDEIYYNPAVIAQDVKKMVERISKVDDLAFKDLLSEKDKDNYETYLKVHKQTLDTKARCGLMPKESKDINVNIDSKSEALKKILDGVVVELSDEEYEEDNK